MSLNSYKDEAKKFLELINAQSEGVTPKLEWLGEEFQLLKNAVNTNEKDKVNHQIYDMLFILFEIAADFDSDLDTEWENGKNRKQQKYINKRV